MININSDATIIFLHFQPDESGVVSANETLTSVSGPIVLQRRGSVYGANVPMITGKNFSIFGFY